MAENEEKIEILVKAGADQTARTKMGLLPAGVTTAAALRAEKIDNNTYKGSNLNPNHIN